MQVKNSFIFHQVEKTPWILCLESSGFNCSVALFSEQKIKQERCLISENYSHIEQLHLFIQAVMQSESLSFDALNAIAVSIGPGSYTGLRIGINAAKGLSYSLNIPLIAIDTLAINPYEAVNFSKKNINLKETDYYISLLDARNQQVYVEIFDQEKNTLVHPQKVKLTDFDFFSPFLTQKTLIFSDQQVHQTYFPDSSFYLRHPQASSMGFLALEKYQNSNFINDLSSEPETIYL